MRRVLVVTWALGTASGVLLGLFGVQLVSSRFSTSRVSPLSHPEVLRALQAARSVTEAPNEVAAAPTPDTAGPPPTDAAPARPSAEATSTPAPASPASSLPRPGATAGPLVETASVPSSSSTTTTAAPAPPPPTSTTATTVKPSSKDKSDSDSKKSKSSTTTTTTRKPTTTTTSDKPSTSSRTQSRSLKSVGGVVVVSWRSDGTVRIEAARPEAGYQMRIWNSGPDKIVVTFVNEREKRGSLVEATNAGPSSGKVTEYRCSGRWGTSSWNCQEV